MTSRHGITRVLPDRCSVGCVMYMLLAILLGSTVALSSTVWSQTETLETGVELTAEIVNANVRTAGQTQRELLRLEAVLLAERVDPEQVDLLRAFVTQRMGEMVLPYHRAALASEELQTQATAIATTWAEDIEPGIEAYVADPVRFAGTVPALIAAVEALELEVNQLTSDAEINRRAQAGVANSAAVDMLDGTRRLLVALVATLTGFVVVSGVAVFAWRRLVRQRERDLAEQLALATEVRTLSLVASSTDNLVIITDAAGRIEWVNDAFTRRTGYALDEVMGLSPGDVLQGPGTDSGTVTAMRAAVARGEGFHVEILNYDRHGTPYWVEIDAQPVRRDDGTIEHFIAVQSDITERRAVAVRLLEAKEAAEGLAAEKAMFLASMSHEIRTPLNAVIGLTGMLLDTELDEEQTQYARTARRSGTLLLELVNNILNFSSLEAGKVELERRPTDVRSLLTEVCELFQERATGKGISLVASVGAAVPSMVEIDPVRLRQVLINLVDNAVKFTDTGGVRVEVVATAGDQLTFHVVDSGVGVPTEMRERLFQPFTQADSSTSRTHGGTGLGLAISRHLVGLLGGTVEVADGEGGGGTRFSFSVAAGRVLPQPASSATVEERPTRARILLAEDDPVNQVVAVHMLGQLDHEVDVVADGYAVLNALAATTYELVLMDIHMPGLDGLATTQRIRATMPAAEQPRIVAMTANALDGDRERFLAGGMDGYVSKPVSAGALRDEIDRVMALPG